MLLVPAAGAAATAACGAEGGLRPGGEGWGAEQGAGQAGQQLQPLQQAAITACAAVLPSRPGAAAEPEAHMVSLCRHEAAAAAAAAAAGAGAAGSRPHTLYLGYLDAHGAWGLYLPAADDASCGELVALHRQLAAPAGGGRRLPQQVAGEELARLLRQALARCSQAGRRRRVFRAVVRAA